MSTKWADYVLTAVRYNSAHTHIMQVHLRLHLSGGIGPASIYSRQQVVDLLKRNATIVTAIFNREMWYKGDNVEIVRINGVDYLRTDGNRTTADNLGNLPEF